MRAMAPNTFLDECRGDRDRYAGYLKDCMEGRFHMPRAGPDGNIRDNTPEDIAHLRRIVATLECLIASIEAGDAYRPPSSEVRPAKASV